MMLGGVEGSADEPGIEVADNVLAVGSAALLRDGLSPGAARLAAL